MYSLKHDPSIIIKGVDKGFVVVVWDREDYLKEAYIQLDDKEEHEQVPNDPSVLANTLMKVLEKIHLRGDLSKDTLDYFLVKDPKFLRFYLLPKIRKRLHNVAVRPVISEFDEKPFKQVRGTAIETKFAPPYAIWFVADLEEKVLNAFEKKAMIWWRYIDGIFFIWEHGEEFWKNLSIN